MERISRAAAVLGIRMPGRGVRLILVSAVTLVGLFQPGLSSAAGILSNATMSLSDPQPGATSSYTLTASSVDTSSTVHCIKEVFATTATGSSVPASMNTTGASFSGTSNYIPTPGSWSLDATTNGTLLLTDTGGEIPASASSRTVIFTGIVNSNTADTGFFVRFNTYGNTNCTSSPIDNAVLMYINTTGSTLSVSVDDSLSFSVNGVASGQSCGGGTTSQTSTATTIPFGSVTVAANNFSCQDLTASTNATHGYTIFARYTGQPSNGSHPFADLSPGTNASPSSFSSNGVEAYGYTTNDQTLSTCGGSCNANRFYDGATYSWAAMTTSNAEVAYEAAGVNSATYRIGHQAGIAAGTPAGTYTTTVIYSCIPVY